MKGYERPLSRVCTRISIRGEGMLPHRPKRCSNPSRSCLDSNWAHEKVVNSWWCQTDDLGKVSYRSVAHNYRTHFFFSLHFFSCFYVHKFTQESCLDLTHALHIDFVRLLTLLLFHLLFLHKHRYYYHHHFSLNKKGTSITLLNIIVTTDMHPNRTSLHRSGNGG